LWRPGRIDQAIEVPPPDADCCRRLFELYGKGLHVDGVDWERLVERTAGASGAFICELLRKAAVFAAEDNGDADLLIRPQHLDEAPAELVIAGGALTHSLLGRRWRGEKISGLAL
jgi:ATP-dependent 26S proteasome regulatory subunit